MVEVNRPVSVSAMICSTEERRDFNSSDDDLEISLVELVVVPLSREESI